MNKIYTMIKSIGKIQKIQLKEVTVVYDKNTLALKDINLVLKKGITLVMGPNGAGKSTLLNTVCGIIKPSLGSVLINDLFDISQLPEDIRSLIIRKHYAYLIQEDIHINHFKVIDNILLPFKIFNLEIPTEKLNYIVEYLGLEKLLSKYPYELSGGEKRKVSLARTLLKAYYSSVILLDEPTSNLDRETVSKLIDLIRELKDEKITIIATHDHALKCLSNNIVYLRSGSLEKYNES